MLSTSIHLGKRNAPHRKEKQERESVAPRSGISHITSLHGPHHVLVSLFFGLFVWLVADDWC
jgi:hypothetical protein